MSTEKIKKAEIKKKMIEIKVESQLKPNPVIPQNITETLETNYMPYAMSVIVSRAIPEIDGFKPAHRKILYTMYNMGLLREDRRKSADVVGQTMKVHPHGDGAIYETLVRLSRGNSALLHPFIDSKGNFGKQYSRDMAYAASRYTEVRLDSICEELFKDIDKNTVDMVDNYDGTMKEPALLPSTFPNILITPNQGIAVGMASSICSFNLKEVCSAVIAFIKNPQVDLMKFISAPDFSTGAEFIYNKNELASIYKTGRGSFKLRAKYKYIKKSSCIEIYEIPYTTTIEAIIDKITALAKSGKIKDITDVRDETGLHGLKITIDIKRSADAEFVMKKLFAQTTLMDSFSCNFNILVDGKPRTMGIGEIISEWLKFRCKCIKRRLLFDYDKNKEKLHVLEGLEKILFDIDKAIHIIRNTEDDNKVIMNLCNGFEINEAQAGFISEIKLRNLNKEYLSNRVRELENIKKEIREIEEILSDDNKIYDIIESELKQISKKYGKPQRQTTIIYEAEEAAVSPEMFIEDYGVKLFLTEHNYFKKITVSSLRSASEQYLKDNDRIVQNLEATNKSEILFFSNKYNVYKMRLYDISECKASAIGEYLPNLLGGDEDEKIVYFTIAGDYTGHMIFAYDNGKMAKVDMAGYATKTNRKKLINAYSDKANLVYMEHIKENKDFLVIRDSDKALLFNTSLLSAIGTKNSAGIQVYTLKKNSIITKMISASDVNSSNAEYYRIEKIPSTGRFLTNSDKCNMDIGTQLTFDII